MRSKFFLLALLIFISNIIYSQHKAQKNIDKGNYKPVIAEYKSKLEKIKKKGESREYDQFPLLVFLASIELEEDPKSLEAVSHYQEALELEMKILEEGYSDAQFWEYTWQLADVSILLGKFDDGKALAGQVLEGIYDDSFLKNSEDSIDFFTEYDWLHSLFGENEMTYSLGSDFPEKPSRLRLLVAGAYERDQRMLQAEEILLQDFSKLKNSPSASPELYLNYLSSLTSFYIDLELFSKAQVYMMEAQVHARKHASLKPDLLLEAYQLTGNYYKAIGNNEKASFYYYRALTDTKQTDPSYIDILISLSEVENSSLKKDSLLKTAEAKSRSSNEASGIELAMDIYDISISIDKREDELRLYREALQIFTRLFPKKNCFYIPRLYSGLGIAYEKQQKFDSARVNFQKSKELSEAMGIQCNKCHGIALIGLGDAALNEGNAQLTYHSYDEASKFYKKIFTNTHSYSRFAASRMIDFHWYYKNQSKANELFTNSFAETAAIIKSYFPALTEQDREKFYENLKKDYDKYPSYVMDFRLTDPSLIGSLYNHQLQTKAFLLSSFNRWKNQILNSGDIKLIKELDRWQTNKELLAKISQLEQADAKTIDIDIDSLTKETDFLERKLYEKAQGYSTEIDQPATWEDIRARLAEGEAAMEIVRYNRYNLLQHNLSDSITYCALIVTPASKIPALVILDRGTTLESKYLKGYLNKSYHQLDDKESFGVFWKKINDQLRGIKKIYFSPDGVYHQININTIQNPATGKYLSEEYEVVQVINTKEVLMKKREETFNKTGLLFGSPDFFSNDNKAAEKFKTSRPAQVKEGTERGIDLQDLPGTKEEVELVSQIMKQKGWNVLLYTNQQATEDNLKSNYKPRVLHIATHGYFNLGGYSDQSLVKSGLIFSGGGKTLTRYLDENVYKPEGEDGILTPFEAMNLNLENTDLVVLSACQSGLGEVKPGEGIYGLQRAFKMAGARSLIISLWPVDDTATKEFTTQFYKSWFLAGLSKADAFKQAQAHLKQKYKVPYYWGAFILVGI